MLPAEVRSRIEYWVVGGRNKGNYEDRLRSQAAADPALTVRFFGNIPDEELAEVYDRADIFALTSINHGHSVEGFGLVYLEAAAHGAAHRRPQGRRRLGSRARRGDRPPCDARTGPPSWRPRLKS